MTQRKYNNYTFSLFQKLIFTTLYLCITSIYALLFYNSLLPVIIFLPLITIFFKILKNALINRQKYILLQQFKEWLFTINSSLSLGYALENAIRESLNEMETIYGTNSYIYEEIFCMSNKLALHTPLDVILSDFADRSGLNDIKNFSEVVSIVKKNGGNMIRVLKESAESIGEEISLKDQINTSVSSAKYELYIMAAFPLLIIIYIDWTQPGFFSPLYHNFFGICVMTACLLIYFTALILAGKILQFTRRF